MCRLRPVVVTALILFAVTVSAPGLARAEMFLDVYGGGAFPMDSDTTIRGPGYTIVGESPYKDSFVVGGRVGYYFTAGAPWLGLALDVSYFEANINLPDGAKNDVVPVSLLLMMRTPLAASQEFPGGRLQPYVGIGPSFVYSRSEAGSSSDTSFDVGFDFRLGLTWMLTRTIGLFGEYRFSYVRPDYDLDGETVEPEFTANHIAAGVTFRF
ncbi:MAG: porin family protein [Zetaproteobacteria bacterium]|nr:MAG: porin family protein [Zetaproteobacteria bacterium]